MLRSTHHDLREKIKFPAAVSCSRLLRRPTSSHTVFASRSRFPERLETPLDSGQAHTTHGRYGLSFPGRPSLPDLRRQSRRRPLLWQSETETKYFEWQRRPSCGRRPKALSLTPWLSRSRFPGHGDERSGAARKRGCAGEEGAKPPDPESRGRSMTRGPRAGHDNGRRDAGPVSHTLCASK